VAAELLIAVAMKVGGIGRGLEAIGLLWMSALAPVGCGGGSSSGGVGSATGTSHVDSGIDGQLTINELMTDNVLSKKDERGAVSPWLEIYNPTGQDVPLDGYGVTDDFSNPKKAVLAGGAVAPAHGYLLLWADGSAWAGPTHVGILLSPKGGSVGLARPDGSYIDRLTYGAQTTDLSAAREPDGSTNWVTEWNISPGAANPGGPAGQPAAPHATGDSPEMVPAAGDVSDRVLGYDLIPQFDLQIADDAIASLRASPQTWVQATIVYQGRSYGPVGVNLKGTASFETIDQKPAFRISATEFAKGARFFGLKKFMLNNMATDPSMIHERLAYWIVRQVGGVPASRCNHSWVTLNGAALGLYATVEEPRSQMMATYFSDPTGGVYTINYADFTSALASNFQYDDGKDDRTQIDATIAALAKTPADAAIAAAGKSVDMHQFARFWAVCVLTGHWGGWPYAATNEPAGANAELYIDPKSNQMSFIPTGINDALASLDYDFVHQVKSVLARNCAASSACYQDFASQLMEVDAKAMQLGWSAEHARVVSQIAPYVPMDTRKPYSNDDVGMYQQQTGFFITGRDAYIQKYLAPLKSP
jgi:hypothetical protein